MKSYLPESIIRFNLQRYGFSKRNLPVLAKKMKCWSGLPVKYDSKKDALYIDKYV